MEWRNFSGFRVFLDFFNIYRPECLRSGEIKNPNFDIRILYRLYFKIMKISTDNGLFVVGDGLLNVFSHSWKWPMWPMSPMWPCCLYKYPVFFNREHGSSSYVVLRLTNILDRIIHRLYTNAFCLSENSWKSPCSRKRWRSCGGTKTGSREVKGGNFK